MSSKRSITVIGGGVVGLSTAWALVGAGHEVTLVERREGVGLESSFANGGQLSYRYVSPLADSGVPFEALSWLFREASPVSLRLRADPREWRWLLAFLCACNAATNRRNAARLLDLALASQRTVDAWRRDGLDGFQWRRAGKLILYRNAAKFRRAARAADGSGEQAVLSPAECARTEPAFAALAPSIAGGIFSPGDEVGDCRLFCDSLFAALSRAPSFRFLCGAASLREDAAGRCAVLVEGKPVGSEEIVLAAGLESREMVRPLGIDLPLYGLKGYSLTLRPPSGALPEVSVTDYDNRVVYARLGDMLRIAAMVDIGAEDTQPNPRRIADLRALATRTLPQAGPYDRAEVWTGLRPATPTGVPLIGRTRLPNLVLNIGHGALGFTLAAGSAVAVAEIVASPDH